MWNELELNQHPHIVFLSWKISTPYCHFLPESTRAFYFTKEVKHQQQDPNTELGIVAKNLPPPALTDLLLWDIWSMTVIYQPLNSELFGTKPLESTIFHYVLSAPS